MKVEKEYRFLDLTRILPWLIILLFGFISYLVFLVYSSYLMSFFIATLFYIIFRKPHYYLVEKLNGNTTLAAILSTVVVILAVFLPLTFIIIALVQELQVAIEHLRNIITEENLILLYEKNRWVDQWFTLSEEELKEFKSYIIGASREAGYYAFRQSGNILVGSLKLSLNFFLSMIILFFYFKGGDKLGPIIYRALPFPDEMEAEIGERMVSVLDTILKGNLMVSVLQGTFVGLLFWFFGLPTPILYGTLAMIFSLVPILGTMIVWLPAAIYLYVETSLGPALALGILAFVGFQLMENILKPWLLDKKLNLHPLFLFLAILGGIGQFGAKGLILGPFLVISLVSLWEMFSLWNEQYGRSTSQT